MVLVALVAPSFFKTLKVTPETLIQSLLFIPHFSQAFNDRIWPLLVPGWTLNYEMFFYAMFGATLYLRRERRLAALTALFLSLVLIGVIAGPLTSAAALTYTNPMLLEFVAGAGIGTAWNIGIRSRTLGISVALIISGLLFLTLRDYPPLGSLTQSLGAILVVWGALSPRVETFRCRLLSLLGDSSYSLYLTHIFSLGLVRSMWGQTGAEIHTNTAAASFMILAITISVAIGWITFKWIEIPLLRVLQRTDANHSFQVRTGD